MMDESTSSDPLKGSRSNPEDAEPRRGKRVKVAKTFGPDFITFILDDEPKSLAEALSSPDALFWQEAINSEIKSIMRNNTWVLVDFPEGCKTFRVQVDPEKEI